MMWIKVLLISAIAVILVFLIRREHGHKIQANKRIAFIAFVALNVYAVLRPQDVSALANLVGVGRGADLVLYLFVITFVFVVLNIYLTMRESDRRLTDLARAMAVREAEMVNRERGVLYEWPAGNPDAARTAK